MIAEIRNYSSVQMSIVESGIQTCIKPAAKDGIGQLMVRCEISFYSAYFAPDILNILIMEFTAK